MWRTEGLLDDLGKSQELDSAHFVQNNLNRATIQKSGGYSCFSHAPCFSSYTHKTSETTSLDFSAVSRH